LAPLVEHVAVHRCFFRALPGIPVINLLATNSAKWHDWPKGLAKKRGGCAWIQSLGPIVYQHGNIGNTGVIVCGTWDWPMGPDGPVSIK